MEKRIRKTAIPKEIIALGKRIQQIIKEKELKVREVAYDANLETENLRKYMKGRQEMKVSTMLKIAKAMGVEVADLFPKKGLVKK